MRHHKGGTTNERKCNMAGQIRMTPDQMRGRAGEFSSDGQELRDLIQKMDTLNNQLQSEWEGAAADQFDARWNGDLKTSFTQAADLIDQVSQALNKSADILEQTDAQMSQQLAG
jgi:WXG100 family type VII secretion target